MDKHFLSQFDMHTWGEEGFIRYLEELFPPKNSVLGIGDDAAVIPMEDDTAWLVTTDALIEGVHFLKEEIPPKDLGYKTVAVNVSDIVAMGGTSRYAFLSIAIPKNTNPSWLKEVIQGMKEALELHHILLLGGDTVGSRRDLFLNLTLIGKGPLANIKYRSSAKTGDTLYVTRFSGDSAGGLKALQNKLPKTPHVTHLIKAHFRPEIQVKEGALLASNPQVHAMMDLSDGLDCDLKRLLKKSSKGAIVDLDKIPLSPELLEVSRNHHWDPLMLALTGGEDYCLLFTAQGTLPNFAYPIGKIVDEPGLVYQKGGKTVFKNLSPYDHFKT